MIFLTRSPMKYFNEYIFSSSRFICLLGSFFFFIGLQARCEVCPCLQVVHPAIFVGRKKVVAAKKAACEMKALFAQPVVTVVTAFLMLSVAVIASYLPRQIQKN